MKILFLVPYPIGQSPSQRFRFEQYFSSLSKAGIQYEIKSFLKSENWRLFYQDGNFFLKIGAIGEGFLKRLIALFKIRDYDFIFIHREVAPVGPPAFEWIIAKVFRKKIVYDFDDAIWLTDKKNESWLEKTIRWRRKLKSICKWSYKVSAGNEYLATYAKQFCRDVIVNPTTIDTEKVHNFSLHLKSNSSDRIIVGWTGSYSTLKYLKGIEALLQRIEAKYAHVDFWVIADRPPDIKLNRMQFKPWSIEAEVSDLSKFDIGIMPLPNDEWTKGKCGFKALQYMAMGIPTVASAVGVNKSIIKHGINGFLVNEATEWDEYLSRLIEDETLRKRIGSVGRKTLESGYSVHSNKERFLSLFNNESATSGEQNN